MASGCTSVSSSNKTYSNNGISFTYPGDWGELNKTDFQNNASTILVAVGNDNATFVLANVTVGANKRIVSTTEWASAYKSSMNKSGYTLISEKSRTVDGVNGYEVVMKKSEIVSSNTYFAKNGNPYLAAFAFEVYDEQAVNMILNSLKVP